MTELAWTAYVTLLDYKSFKSQVWQKIVLECFFTMFMFFGSIQNSKMISTGGDNLRLEPLQKNNLLRNL